MKKTILNLAIVTILAVAGIIACKKAGSSQSELFSGPGRSMNATDRTMVACDVVTLSGNIEENMTLDATKLYKLSGCVVVKSPYKLTIPAGTVIQGIKPSVGGQPAFLIIERGAKLDALGTSSNPVIFTSDQAVNSRAAGDWGGLRLFGYAENNNSNSLPVDLGCDTYTGGGNNDADNSGKLQYVQIHYAGAKGASGDPSQAGLMLNSVGTGTIIDHIQVTNAINDSYAVFGGKVKLENLISYNADRVDFQIEFGYIGNMQFLGGMRLKNSAVPSANAYGLNIVNNRFNPTNTRLTQPVISNVSVLGPNFCSVTGVNGNFQYAVRFADNAAGRVYNSVFSSWNARGLLIESAASVAHTASGAIVFSYNSFHNSGATPYAFSSAFTWTGSSGCGTSMAQWMTGFTGCSQTGNQLSVTTLAYNSSFCDDFCANGFSSNFTLNTGSTSLSSPDFTWTGAGSFTTTTYRGAFGSSDWTQSWTDWCPQSTGYCI